MTPVDFRCGLLDSGREAESRPRSPAADELHFYAAIHDSELTRGLALLLRHPRLAEAGEISASILRSAEAPDHATAADGAVPFTIAAMK